MDECLQTSAVWCNEDMYRQGLWRKTPWNNEEDLRFLHILRSSLQALCRSAGSAFKKLSLIRSGRPTFRLSSRNSNYSLSNSQSVSFSHFTLYLSVSQLLSPFPLLSIAQVIKRNKPGYLQLTKQAKNIPLL